MRRFVRAVAVVLVAGTVSLGAVATADAAVVAGTSPSAASASAPVKADPNARAAATAGATTAATTAARPGVTKVRKYAGCPYGAVCIYPDASFRHNPEYVFYSYGPHAFRNEYGKHRVFNNQYGHAWVRACRGSRGTSCEGWLDDFALWDINLTPYNSLRLVRSRH